MEEQKQVSTYYKEMIPELIDKYKLLVEQCFEIVDAPIDINLTGDKRHAELRSKRDAMTDAQFYARQIDDLENERNGIELTSDSEDEKETTEPKTQNWAKRKAKRPA